MKKSYLKDGSRVFATGVFLIWDAKNKKYIVDSFEDDIFYDGISVQTDENDLPYLEFEE